MKQKTTPTQRALNLWAVILIVWALYRTYFKMPSWFDEFVAKPLVFVLPVVYYIKNIEKKSVLSELYLKLKPKKIIEDVVYSLAVAVILVGSAALALSIRMKKPTLFVGPLPSTDYIISAVVLALATGITEEILSRGFVLKKLYDESKNMYSSIFLSSILFFFLHVPILFSDYRMVGNVLVGFILVDIMLSIINGYLFIQRKSLLMPILIHAFYNIIVAIIFI